MKSLLAAAACASAASAASLASRRVAFLQRQAEDPPSNEAIHEKWDKMDEFLEIMFTIACKWKHGKDVDGATAHAVKEGDIEYKTAISFKKDVHKDNVQGLIRSCGMVVANGKGKCRQGCADRWGDKMVQRNACDGKCGRVYDSFESRCKAKVENLEKVYEMKVSAETARDQCYNGHCKEFPSVWLKASEAEMAAEVQAQCGQRCTAEQIAQRCETRWTLQADFVRGGVKSTCAEESGSTACFQRQKGLVSAEHDACSANGKSTCESQFQDCTAKGNTDASHKEAGEFCAERQRLCLEQVDANCLADHKAALAKAQSSCEAEAKVAFDKCEADAMKAKGDAAKQSCEAELTPKCPEDCAEKCKAAELHSCLTGLQSESDPAEEFCVDFWKLLHETSEVDPVTGDPIVLLASSAQRK